MHCCPSKPALCANRSNTGSMFSEFSNTSEIQSLLCCTSWMRASAGCLVLVGEGMYSSTVDRYVATYEGTSSHAEAECFAGVIEITTGTSSSVRSPSLSLESSLSGLEVGSVSKLLNVELELSQACIRICFKLTCCEHSQSTTIAHGKRVGRCSCG